MTKPWRTWRGCQLRRRWRARPKVLTRRAWHRDRAIFLKPLLDSLEGLTIAFPQVARMLEQANERLKELRAPRIARAKRTARPDVPEIRFGIMGEGE